MWRRMKELGRFGVMFQVLSTRCHMATMRRFSKIHILSHTLMHTPQSLPISVTQEEWEGLLPILTNLKSEFRYQEKFNVQVRAGKILSDHSEDLSLLRLKSSGSSEIFACKPSDSGSISIKSARALLIGGGVGGRVDPLLMKCPLLHEAPSQGHGQDLISAPLQQVIFLTPQPGT